MRLTDALLSVTLASASAIDGTGAYGAELKEKFYKPAAEFFWDVVGHKNERLSTSVHKWNMSLHAELQPYIDARVRTELELLPHLADLNAKLPAIVDNIQLAIVRSKPWIQNQQQCGDARVAVCDLRTQLTFFAEFMANSLMVTNWKADPSDDVTSKKDEVDAIMARLTREFEEGECIDGRPANE
ncbi:hypothetical protein DCS_03386 [Drechmeria coniospora]|uniref:Uncharacterized protein n=1 Tax=Drechmeria coniospora TaxID=98403 RepID=A0A151GH43_DRECN|nr:hypothetical protein DCS_03386 [Drechmeria coniospora]KYK56386.1 hypothetical protein DCS_03386 [Drechmeria coniospora]ODA76838.1 hypothetical protein RJ55_07354 [Drechmeria coniospora]